MSEETITKKDSKNKFKTLEWFIVLMAGIVLGSLEAVNCLFFNLSYYRGIVDWFFGMALIVFIIHLSFRQIFKIQDKLVLKREQVKQADRSLRHIVDNTCDAIFTIDLQGRYTFANKPTEMLTGYSTERLMKTGINDIVSPEYRPLVQEHLKVVADDEPFKYPLEFEIVKPDGSTVPVEMNFMPVKNGKGDITAFQGVAKDVTRAKELEKSREEKRRYLQAIAKVGQIILETPAILPYFEMLEVLGTASEAQNARVFLRNNGSSKDSGWKKEAEWKLKTGAVLSGADTKANYPTDENIRKLRESLKLTGKPSRSIKGNRSVITFPIVIKKEIEGFVSFTKSSDHPRWTSEHMNLLTTAINMLAHAMERQKTNEQLKQHFVSLAGAVSNALFFVDPYTANHQKRVAEMALYIGNKLGLGQERCEWLHFGGLLHDIGKATIPNTILSKPGKLTEEEWILVKSHARRGYDILKEMNLPDQVTDLVLHHHERLNGSGYPDGLGEGELSAEVRILGLCDVIEAMSSHRPYRPARTFDEINDELIAGMGNKYDREMVELILEQLGNGGYNILIGGEKNKSAVN
jgi:PAS domain S-box-containing protein/putative nucleotidyltransferase with HDIG domain